MFVLFIFWTTTENQFSVFYLLEAKKEHFYCTIKKFGHDIFENLEDVMTTTRVVIYNVSLTI